jgi:hypothetical protein
MNELPFPQELHGVEARVRETTALEPEGHPLDIQGISALGDRIFGGAENDLAVPLITADNPRTPRPVETGENEEHTEALQEKRTWRVVNGPDTAHQTVDRIASLIPRIYAVVVAQQHVPHYRW